MVLVVAVCALVGALAGIAGSAAAPSSKKSNAHTQKKAAKKQMRAFRRGFRMGFGGPLGGPVHSVAVVPQRDGSGFDTITVDGGTLLSVDGTTLHVKEAVGNNVYRDDASIDVGSDAKVIRNGADAKLSDLKAGDHVRVITGAPKGNIVLAADDTFIKQRRDRFERHHGWGPRGGPGGPPPGAPGDQQGGSNQNGSDSGPSGSSSSS
jgi:hypothetical protein